MIETDKNDLTILPVSLATFHLVMVSLWRASIAGSVIEATQRCTNALTMDGCVPLRLRLNSNESFVRVELTAGAPAKEVEATWTKLCESVCHQTRTLKWGWRGRAVVVPVHPFPASNGTQCPLFDPDLVAKQLEYCRHAATVRSELARHSGQKVQYNVNLESWWVKQQRT